MVDVVVKLELTVNGEVVTLEAEPDDVLLDVLRAHGATEVKEGCGVGVCGACSVLVDDAPVSSCIYLAMLASGAEVWTSKGLVEREPALLEAFVESEAMQCGICTPGQVVAVAALRRESVDQSEEAVRAFMAGNLCRCTGYATIIEAARRYLDGSAI